MAEARRLLQPVAAGLAALAIVLAGSAATVDLGAAGWLAGSACGAAVIGSVALGLHRARDHAYASMRDQYVYLGLQRLELAKRDRPPLFAEVDLVSSHEPWTQIPPLGTRSVTDPSSTGGRSTRPGCATPRRPMAGRSSTPCGRCSRSCSITGAGTWS